MVDVLEQGRRVEAMHLNTGDGLPSVGVADNPAIIK